MTILTQDILKSLLSYDPDTGIFTWLVRRGSRGAIGAQITRLTKSGYVYVGIDKRAYLAHRLAWLYVYGVWPDGGIDHINQNRVDNRIANLRLANKSENGQNRAAPKHNKSGVKGVYWSHRENKWVAAIRADKQCLRLGAFTNLADAARVRAEAELKYHPYRPR